MNMDPRNTTIKSIIVEGRRWFDGCNTYHKATIYINGNHVHTTKRTYGYEQQYLHTAYEWLQESGFVTMDSKRQAPFRHAQEHDYILEYSAVDVKRKKDL